MFLNGFGAKSLLSFKNGKYFRDVGRKHSCFPSQTAGFAVLLPRGQSNNALASISSPPRWLETLHSINPVPAFKEGAASQQSPDIIAVMHLEAFSMRQYGNTWLSSSWLAWNDFQQLLYIILNTCSQLRKALCPCRAMKQFWMF